VAIYLAPILKFRIDGNWKRWDAFSQKHAGVSSKSVGLGVWVKSFGSMMANSVD